MIELFETEKIENERHSSKGNQLKWKRNGVWYKADSLGYEGMAEVVVSHLLRFSDLKPTEYITYEPEQIRYRQAVYNGTFSEDFLKGRGELITLERLFKNNQGRSLHEAIYSIADVRERLKVLVDSIASITGLSDFGKYMSRILTVDAFFLNDDRHTHNIAVIKCNDGRYDYCPVFDNGGALLSDTSLDYPMGGDIYELIATARSKTVSLSFDEQLEAAEVLYGDNIRFHFGDRDILDAVEGAGAYPPDQKTRVVDILREQRRKYRYLFGDG